MTARRTVTILAGASALAVAVSPAAARAATTTVTAGPPTSAAPSFQRLGSDVSDFFPHGVTIHVGDSVKFVPVGFHSVDLPGRARSDLPLWSPTGQPVSNALDAAGQAFWFNGRPSIGFNSDLGPAWGRSTTYDGRSRLESGLPVLPQNGPLTVKFARKGSFTYFCDVHPGMKGVVHVVARRAAVPTARSDARSLARQVKRDLAIARRLQKPPRNKDVVDVGLGGPQGVEHFAFLPGTLRVKAGTTVRFRMTPLSRETHTATTGPGAPDQAGTYLGDLGASFESPAPSPIAFYPSERPGTFGPLTAALHGNGFWNSGAMDLERGIPEPRAASVTFAEKGTFRFYCLIHPFMHGTVVVH